jgi:hypothetical protein
MTAGTSLVGAWTIFVTDTVPPSVAVPGPDELLPHAARASDAPANTTNVNVRNSFLVIDDLLLNPEKIDSKKLSN